MYTVHTYCIVPDHVAITEAVLRVLKNKELVNGGFAVRTFEDKDALYSYVRGFDHTGYFSEMRGHYYGTYSRFDDDKFSKHRRNHFLEATMCSPNDSLRHRHTFESSRRPSWSKSRFAVDDHYWTGYLVRNERGSVVDLRLYKDELFAFDVDAYNEAERQERLIKHKAIWEEKEARWDKAKSLYALPDWHGYCRSIHSMPEKRAAAIPEHRPFIRGRRSVNRLPDSYDDIGYCWTKNWKRRDRKARKQWETNLKKHIDTVKTRKNEQSEDDCSFDFAPQVYV